MSKFLSIIIPVYNAEKYLAECLDSCLNQDIAPEDYEIICVNDGSKDGSWEILCNYAEKHPNIIAINRENGGVSAARNTGMDTASGDYIWFVDSDDFIQDNCLNKMRETVEKSGCKRLTFRFYEFNNALTENEKKLKAEHIVFSDSHMGYTCLTASLFKRSVIEESALRFDCGLQFAEDVLLGCEFDDLIEEKEYLEELNYFYRKNETSVTCQSDKSTKEKYISSHIKAARAMKNIYDKSEKNRSSKAIYIMHFLMCIMIELAQMPYKATKGYMEQLKTLGLFPFKKPVEFTETRAFTTTRKDIIGKIYNWLCINCTTRGGYFLMRVWYKIYGIIKH